MSNSLIDFYNAQKSAFVEEIVKEVKAQGGDIEFTPHIRINGRRDSDIKVTEYASITWDYNVCYVENREWRGPYSCMDYDTPLINLTYEELYKIAERL